MIEPLDAVLRTESPAGYFKSLFVLYHHNAYLALLIHIRPTVARAVHGFGPFLFKNRLSVTMPRVLSFLLELRKAEAARLPVGVAGFCWGGGHIMQLATEPPSNNKALVDVCFTAHPSGLSFPKDIEGVRKPLSVAIGDKDPLMTPKQSQETEAVLKKNMVEQEVVIYQGAGHGFSVRIDRTNPKQSEQAVLAEQQAVKWFTKHFEKS